MTVQTAPLPAAEPVTIRLLLALLLATSGALMTWHGMAEPHGGRFWDERYGFANVEAVMFSDDGPANAFYPSLSYLPQVAALWLVDGLHDLTGRPGLTIRRAVDPDTPERDPWTPTAYRTVRLVSALFGVLAVWAAFGLGRRLFGPWAGLAGATLFAAQPALIQASAIFKPDVLVVLGVLVVFVWSLDALERPSWRRYARVGVGIGCTVAAKYTGVGAALPLTLGTLRRSPRPTRQWLWLVAAGVVSLVTFVVLNPHIATILAYIPRLFEIAESKSAAEGGSHAKVLLHQGRFLVRHHGLPVLVLVAAGLVGLGRRALVGTDPDVADAPAPHRPSRMEALLVLGFVLGYSLLYAAVVEAFRGQNYLPVSALTALTAGWVVVALGRGLADRAPVLARPAVAVSLALLSAAAVFAHPVGWVYEQVVPTTWQSAGRVLSVRYDPVRFRHVVFERAPGSGRDERVETFRGSHRMATWGVPSLWDVDDDVLAGADVLAFREDRLRAEDGDRYLSWLTRPGLVIERYRHDTGRRRGVDLMVVRQPWERIGPEGGVGVEIDDDGRVAWPLEPLEGLQPGERWSLSAWLPRRPGEPRARTVRLKDPAGGATPEASLSVTRVSGRRIHYLSTRFVPPGDLEEARLVVLGPDGTRWPPPLPTGVPASPDGRPPMEPEWTLHRWVPGDGS